jgi:penicillin-binding protein 2
MKNTPSYKHQRQLQMVLYVCCAALVLILARLFYLQIDKQGIFATLGERNFLRMEVIAPLRGDVYDRHHQLLAANRPVYDVSWHNISDAPMTEEDKILLETLSDLLGINLDDGDKRQQLQFCHRFARRFLLKEDVTFEQLCKISEQCMHAPHVVITNRFKRLYPHQSLGCHVLGYLNRIENVGKSGIEYHFDQQLQGEQGYAMHMINATGKTLMKKIHTHAKAGTDITLTIDLQMQQLAEGLFSPDQAGAVIVMDPATGALRALASYPTFDPNAFLSPLSDDEWTRLAINNPLMNRATSALYPPASTFKLVSMTAGLEDKLIDTNTDVFCTGHIEYGGRKYHCIRRTGHGALTPKEALSVSCNIPLFNLARKISVDRVAWYADLFGLGQKTDLSLPEKAGLVPTRAWKRQVLGERWWTGETLSICIGQGYTLVTPLQIARMVSAVCAGNLVKPRLLEQEPVVHSPLPVSNETLSFLRSGMKGTVQMGSAQRLKYIRGFEVGAKTGTAQTCSLSTEQVYKHQLEHAWFCGFFTYEHQDPLVLVILLENAGSSRYAVDMADRFLRGYRALLGGEGSLVSSSAYAELKTLPAQPTPDIAPLGLETEEKD